MAEGARAVWARCLFAAGDFAGMKAALGAKTAGSATGEAAASASWAYWGSRLALRGGETTDRAKARKFLASAGMGVSNLVSLRTYLADPKYDEQNARMRARQLGPHRVASTVVCCQLLEQKWKLEIEAVAAA